MKYLFQGRWTANFMQSSLWFINNQYAFIHALRLARHFPLQPSPLSTTSRSFPLPLLNLLLRHSSAPISHVLSHPKNLTYQGSHSPMQRMPMVSSKLGIRPHERRVSVGFGLLDAIGRWVFVSGLFSESTAYFASECSGAWIKD